MKPVRLSVLLLSATFILDATTAIGEETVAQPSPMPTAIRTTLEEQREAKRQEREREEEAERDEHAPKPAANAAQYGPWGFDGNGADFTTKPGDDFFVFANGAWLKRTEIPADKPAYSLRLAMTDLTEQRLAALMEQAASKPPKVATTIEAKVGAFYKSFMDEPSVEKAGASPLKDILEEIRAAKDGDALAAQMAVTTQTSKVRSSASGLTWM